MGDADVPLIGLTGGLGSGKSTALDALERLGAAVLSTDAVVHELYEDPAIVAAVVDRWGYEVMDGGRVDRAAIAGRAFADDEERRWLEGLLWPLVGARVLRWSAEARSRVPAPRAAVVETPLLFEAGMDAAYEHTIAIVSDETLRADRAAARGHAAVDERAARQMSQADKAARATFVVTNDGSVEELEGALAEVLERLGR